MLEALKLTPETASDTLLAADLAEASGQHEAAEAAYRRIPLRSLIQNPSPRTPALPTFSSRANTISRPGEFVRTALEQSPDDPALNAQLATVLAAQNNADALPLLQKLHAAHPLDPAITRMLADVLAQAGQFEASNKLYFALLAKSPDDVRTARRPRAESGFVNSTSMKR